MNIKIRKLFFILFLVIFLIPINIKADVRCDQVYDEVEKYNEIVTELDGISCDDTENRDTVIKCNELKTQKSYQLSKLFKYNDLKSDDCYDPELNRIIKENKENCSNVYGSTLKDFTKSVMKIFYIVAPFLLIIFGSIDFSQIVIMNDPKTIKTSRNKFFKRLAAFVLLYLVPAFVNLILNFNFSSYSLTGNVYSCKTELAFETNRWDITYIPPANEDNKNYRTGGTYTGSGDVVIGGITTDEEADKLDADLKAMLHTQRHGGIGRTDGGMYQDGPFPEWYNSNENYASGSGLQPFQCTWWANGRATQYLAKYGTKYKAYPTLKGNGGMYYQNNKNGGWFKYGQTPKPNSIISWTKGGQAGHVAYVEGVSSDGIYISHAGDGLDWFGIKKIGLDGNIGWSGYTLNGYVYLDEPN